MRLSAARPALTTEEFSALMAPFCPFESRPVLAVGVSGGRDSLALVLLAQEWARARAGRAIAAIVDHGLRAGSAAEAAATRDLLARHAIEAEILRWTGAKPAKNLLVKPAKSGVKAGLETAAVAAASGAALKVAGKLGRKVTEKVKDAVEGRKETETPAQQA